MREEEDLIDEELKDFVGKQFKGKFIEENYGPGFGAMCSGFNNTVSQTDLNTITRIFKKKGKGKSNDI